MVESGDSTRCAETSGKRQACLPANERMAISSWRRHRGGRMPQWREKKTHLISIPVISMTDGTSHKIYRTMRPQSIDGACQLITSQLQEICYSKRVVSALISAQIVRSQKLSAINETYRNYIGHVNVYNCFICHIPI